MHFTDMVVHDLETMHPTNWEALASSAKLIQGINEDKAHQLAIILIDPVQSRRYDHKRRRNMREDFKRFNAAAEFANQMYLGAKSARTSSYSSDFAKAKIQERAIEAAAIGVMVAELVDAARIVAYPQAWGVEGKEYELVFPTFESLCEEKVPVRSDADTMASVVKSEAGILPERIMRAIWANLKRLELATSANFGY